MRLLLLLLAFRFLVFFLSFGNCRNQIIALPIPHVVFIEHSLSNPSASWRHLAYCSSLAVKDSSDVKRGTISDFKRQKAAPDRRHVVRRERLIAAIAPGALAEIDRERSKDAEEKNREAVTAVGRHLELMASRARSLARSGYKKKKKKPETTANSQLFLLSLAEKTVVLMMLIASNNRMFAEEEKLKSNWSTSEEENEKKRESDRQRRGNKQERRRKERAMGEWEIGKERENGSEELAEGNSRQKSTPPLTFG